ncbi:MAG: DNA-binding NarL/FixJ family response regulator [Natronomonas sp.]|jgi:DNA-binding NarL/FixJ family response regulator|uniref:response regulator n=1 Tax=Natronomonas sp. TaxID=2184060 RepID=UPI003989DE45
MDDSIQVLHVDDDDAFRDLAAEFLERADESITVLSESDPTAVPAYIEAEHVDCIVSDFDMPECDGLELCEGIRRDYPEFPFVLFTNRTGEEIVERAMSAGATDYIPKETGTHHYKLLANRITLAVTRYQALSHLGEIDELPGGRAASETPLDG